MGDEARGADPYAAGGTPARGKRAPLAPAAVVHPEGTVIVDGVAVRPGHRQRIDIHVARLPTGASMAMPVIVVNGTKPGPSIWLSAAIHGDELNGIEIIRRVLTTLTPTSLSGTVYAVPVVNAFGFVNEQRYMPDRRDLNRSFPGSKTGSLAARIAYLFLEQIVANCSIGIDLHTGSGGRTNLPQVRLNKDDADVVAIARAFAPPSIIYGATRTGTLRSAAAKRGVQVIVYEAGEASRLDNSAIEVGTGGVLRVFKHLGMIADAPAATGSIFESEKTEWVRARRSGLAHFWVALGTRVMRRQPLGIITDTCGEVTSTITASCDGLVIGRAVNPHAYQGDAMVHIGRPME